MLWDQLNKETREHHITCVELFYRLHCLAPTANICEDIICHALLDPDKVSPAPASSWLLSLPHLACPTQTGRTQSPLSSADVLMSRGAGLGRFWEPEP